MSRQPRFENTQTATERAIWRRIRTEQAKRVAEKRKAHGLRSNREAHLHIAPRRKDGT